MTDQHEGIATAIVEAATARPAGGPIKRRRAKIFTVHGTFDNEAGWDNWDPTDKRPDGSCRLFVNRLSDELRDRGIDLDQEDHTQFNWSGGNSHDERRIAALGLKKRIQAELAETYAKHGKDYYDGGVHIVGHSHGGTVARLAMNLWDKDSKYYDPINKGTIEEELKHDDTCPVCMRDRNGLVGVNTVPRPDRVITFGSPFVTFERRRGSGLLTTRIGVWIFRLLALIPLIAAYVYMAFLNAETKGPGAAADVAPGQSAGGPSVAGQLAAGQDTFVETGVQLVLPLVLFWLVAVYLPGRVLALVDRLLGNGNVKLYLSLAATALRMAGMAAVAVYYVAYLVGAWGSGAWAGGNEGGWRAATRLFPFLETRHLDDWLYWGLPVIAYWLLAVHLPGRYLSWISHEVAALRDKLPKKYDPPEADPAAYLNYHTPGDEAGVHLRNFGVITWLIQTLSYAAVAVLAFGFVLALFIGLETLLSKTPGGSLFSRMGMSAWSGDRAQQDNFIKLVDFLTFYPASVWAWIYGAAGFPVLGTLANKYDVVQHVPQALLWAVVKLLFLTMPLALLALALASFVSGRLRGSGKVFGSERLAWTMANRIGVSRRANANSMLRTVFITPEAWRNGELAHCYYYKSDPVTKDVADHIADPARHVPN